LNEKGEIYIIGSESNQKSNLCREAKKGRIQMKRLTFMIILVILSGCSLPQTPAKQWQEGEVRVTYNNRDTGERVTAIEFLNSFAFGTNTINTDEFQKLPLQDRINLRHALTDSEFESLTDTVKILLPSDRSGLNSLSSEAVNQRFFEDLKNQPAHELASVPEAIRKEMAQVLNREQFNSLSHEKQKLLTFTNNQ
jgi:translation initiation factor 1 (eIF-1/SUI1)